MGILRSLRLGRRSRWAVAAVFVLLFATVVGLSVERFAIPSHDTLVQSINQQIQPMRIAASSSRISLLRPPGRISLSLNEIDLRDEKGDRILTARRLSLQIGLELLTGGPLQIWRVRLEAPEMAVEENLEQLTAMAGGGGFGSLNEALAMVLPSDGTVLEVVDGRVLWRTGSGAWSWEDLRLAGAGSTQNGRGMGSARLVRSDGGEAGSVVWNVEWSEDGAVQMVAKTRSIPVEALPVSLPGLPANSRFSVEFQAERDSDVGLRSLRGRFLMDAGADEGLWGQTIERASGSFQYRPEGNAVDLANLRVEFPALEITGQLAAQLDVAGSIAEAAGSFSTGGGELAVLGGAPLIIGPSESRFTYRPAAEGLDLEGLRVSVGVVSMQGSMHVKQEEGGTTDIQLEMQELALSEMPGGLGPFVVSDVRGTVVYDPDRQIATSRNASARIGDTAVSLQLSATDFQENLRSAELAMEVSTLTAEQALDIWPEQMQPRARQWVASSVQAAHIRPALRFHGFDGKPKIEIDFEYTESTFRVAAGLPPVKDANGSGHVRSDGTQIQIEGGVLVANQGRVQLRSGEFAYDLASKTFDVEAKLGGTAVATLSLAQGLMPGDFGVVPASGDAELMLKMTASPVVRAGSQPGFKIEGYSLQASINGVDLPGNGFGVGLEDISGLAQFGPGRAEFRGAAKVGGMPMKVRVEQSEPGSFVVIGEILVENARFTQAGTSASGMLPLVANINFESTNLVDFALEAGLDGIDLNLVNRFPLPLTGTLNVKGTISSAGAVLNEASLTALGAKVSLAEPLEIREDYALRMEGSMSSDWIRKIAPDLVPSSPAILPMRMSINPQQGGGDILIAGWADIATVGLEVPPAGYRKPAGESGEIEFEGRLSGGGLWLGHFSIHSDLLTTSGVLRFDSTGQIEEARFDSVRLGDRSQFGISLKRDGSGRLDIKLQGNSLDMCDLARLGGEPLNGKCYVSGNGAQNEIALDINLRRLHFNNLIWLEDVEGVVRLGRGRPADGFLTGMALGGASARVVLSGVSGASAEFFAEDAGDLLDSLGYTSELEGGTLRYAKLKDKPGEPDVAHFSLRISDVYVTESNLISKLISFISAFGFIEYAISGREYFSEVEFEIEERSGVIHIVRGFAKSNHVTFSFTGDYDVGKESLAIDGFAIPARFLRQLIGEVPVIGWVVPPEEETGNLGVGFRIQGPVSDPALEVRPLGVLETIIPGLQARSPDQAGPGAGGLGEGNQ